MSTLNGYLSTSPSDLLSSPAIIRVGSTNLGLTRGGVKFENGWNIETLSFDGMQAPIKGLQRKFYGEAKMTFTLMDIGLAATGNQIAKLEANSAAATAGGAGVSVTTITPEDGGTVYASANYLSNVRAIWDRTAGSGINRYFTILFATAYVVKWSVNDSARDIATVDVELCAVKDMASGTTNDAPYVIEYREALP